MRRLSCRRRDSGVFEIGPCGFGPTVMVAATSRREAIRMGKAKLTSQGHRATIAAMPKFTERTKAQKEDE